MREPLILSYTSCWLFLLFLTSTAGAQIPEAEKDIILKETNAFLATQQRPPLTVSYHLSQIAQSHCDNMARLDKYGDDNKTGHVLFGKGVSDRARDAKYGFLSLGENVGKGGSQEARIGRIAIKAWINSPGHRKNILNEQFTEIGIGLAKSKSGTWYFAQVFAKPRPADPSTAGVRPITIFNQTSEQIVATFSTINKQYPIRPKTGFSLRLRQNKKLKATLLDSAGKQIATFAATNGDVFAVTQSKDGQYQVKASE